MSQRLSTKVSQSIIFKSICLLVLPMTLITCLGTFVYLNRLKTEELNRAFEKNEIHVSNAIKVANSEFKQFENRLVFLAKTSDVQSLDKTIASSYLKSYSIQSLFKYRETISLFDRRDSLICNNFMLGNKEIKYPINFDRITSHQTLKTKWYRDTKEPIKAFATVVEDRASGDGSLVASFSSQRLWDIFTSTQEEKKGFIVAIDGDENIIYHPDLRTWLTSPHKIGELINQEIDPRNFKISNPSPTEWSDGNRYLMSYGYDPAYDIGVFYCQSMEEIEKFLILPKIMGLSFLLFAIFTILLVALWQYKILGKPLAKVIKHITQMTEDKLNVDEIRVKNSKDEIGQLSKAFNELHSTIKRQILELNAHRNLLEQEVKQRTQELELANAKLNKISRTDELTGLPNRRDITETINHEMGRVNRSHKPFCFIFIDIDHFKNINDTYGHSCGDLILKSVAQNIRSQLRKYDVIARYGGEEFLTLLPETDLEGAVVVAERFRQKIQNMSVDYMGCPIQVTITLGVAQYNEKLGAERSIQLADKALYEGKTSGRNKVVAWKPEQDAEKIL
ncbi:MAG: diguanylate cyclase [Fibrobacteraceae bacterium]|nr:diguanylate cyclase [Fibrobacteraceae bacterium]